MGLDNLVSVAETLMVIVKKIILVALILSFLAPVPLVWAGGLSIRPMPQRSIFESGGSKGVRYASMSIRPMPQGSIFEAGDFADDDDGGEIVVRGGCPKRYDELISKAAERFRLEVALIKAIIKAESNFNHKAVSHAGARGLMQLMPGTASIHNVENVFHPGENIEGGARHLRYLMNLYNGNLTLVLAAYNAGEKAVEKYGNAVPPYRETRYYVRRVLALYNHYRKKP